MRGGAPGRLYDFTALVLATYARARYGVRTLGAPFTMEPRTLIVSSHRSDDDVPVLVAGIYRQAHGRLRSRHGPGLHFAVRDDLFLRGFFGGYPERLPGLVRRALFPVDLGSILHERLQCHPIRSATRMRLVEYLRAFEPESELLRAKHAQQLWSVLAPDELDVPEAWAQRRASAIEDFRELVGVVRDGGTLVIFPEGRPSPDGTVGPLMDGVGAIVRRAQPRRVVAVAPAYDPLVEGRPRAYFAISPPSPAEVDVLDLLKRTTPLTVGDSVAAALADHADPDRRLEEDVAAAREEGRPYEPELDDREIRRARVETAVRVAGARPLDRLVRTYRSVRA
jgi:1-acyl-sn-glycerol-3-phosphate acyltransferase